MIWKTPYNKLNQGKYYETNNDPSETLPDQSMTVSEIMRRYAMGLPLGGSREPVFNGDNEESEEMMNYERMDKIEKIEMQRKHQEKLKKLNDQYEAEEKEKRGKKYVQDIEDEVTKRINILKKPSPPGNEGN